LAGGGGERIAATIPIPAEGGVIGRSEHAAMQVLEPTISREHAKLSLTPMGWLLQKLEGADEVLVGGREVAEQELESGDVITLGEVRLRFENTDPKAKSTVVLGDWQPPSAVRRRIEAPPSAFGSVGQSGVLEAVAPEPDDALAPTRAPRQGRTTQRPKRIIPKPKSVGGFDAVSTGLQAPVGVGAAPSIESDFNRTDDPSPLSGGIPEPVSAAERSRSMRKTQMRGYAGWIVAALLAITVIALLVRG
jgi:hypothetical protein